MTDDLISRQAVLKQLKGCLTGGETEYQYMKLHIDSIPPVIPQPKTGHWIFCENSYWKEVYKCSECNKVNTKTGCWNHRWTLEKYCPNCGAKMKERLYFA